MPAYIIADIQVTDPVQYEEYKKLSSAAMQAHGAEVLVRGGGTERLEGREPGRTIVLKFSSMTAARAFLRQRGIPQGPHRARERGDHEHVHR